MNSYKTLNEEKLTELLNVRDIQAFEEVYNRYWAVMLQFARKMINDNDQAKDIVQDAFVGLYKNMGIDGYFKKTIQPYLYTSVRNKVINSVVRDKRLSSYMDSLRDYIHAGEFTTDEKIRENEIIRQIDQEIARMPEMMRTVFELSRKQYLSRKEVAEATNLPEEKVKKQLAKAIKLLKNKLGVYLFFQIMMVLLWMNRHM